MALNLSRIFRGRPDQVAVGDVNGDGKADAVHDRYADQEVSYIGETEKHAPAAEIEPTNVEFPNLVRDGGQQTQAQFNPKELGVNAVAPEPAHADGYTATDDLWKFRDGAPSDGSELARSAGPGQQAQGFMMQDGELYPRGLRDMEISLGAVGEPQALTGDANGDGVVDAADYVVLRDRAPQGVKWEGPDFDASKNDEHHTVGHDVAPVQGPQAEGFHVEVDGMSGGYLSSLRSEGGGQGGGFVASSYEMSKSDGFQAMPDLDANANSATGNADYNLGDTATHERVAHPGLLTPALTNNENITEVGAGAQPQPAGLNNGFDQEGTSAGFRPSPTGDGTTEQFFRPSPTGDGTTQQFKSTSGMDAETERSAHHPGPAHFGDTPALNGGDMLAKSEVSIESLELAHEGAVQDGAPGGAHDGAGFYALPEVDDEVLVSFSSLDADADAPSTLVDIHTPGDVPVEHLQDHSGLLDALHDGHHDAGVHHGGHGHENVLDHIPDIDL